MKFLLFTWLMMWSWVAMGNGTIGDTGLPDPCRGVPPTKEIYKRLKTGSYQSKDLKRFKACVELRIRRLQEAIKRQREAAKAAKRWEA